MLNDQVLIKSVGLGGKYMLCSLVAINRQVPPGLMVQQVKLYAKRPGPDKMSDHWFGLGGT